MDRTLLAFALLLGIACTTSVGRHEVSDYYGNPVTKKEQNRYGDVFSWQKNGPMKFLALLKEIAQSKHGWPIYVVVGSHKGWVTAADVSPLMALLDSTEPCANVMQGQSSYIDVHPSTVGNEAAFMIDGFRKGEYPPGLNSTYGYHPDKAALRRWFQTWKNGA